MPEGTFAVALGKQTQEKFEVVANWHLSLLEPQKEIPLEVLQADVEQRKEDSEFFAFAETIKNCRLLAPLLIYDPTLQFGEQYLICLTSKLLCKLLVPIVCLKVNLKLKLRLQSLYLVPLNL